MEMLLTISELPRTFEYPPEFVRVVELGITKLEPWWVLSGEELRRRDQGLKERYPARTLVPIAIRQDRDDVACFDVDCGDVALIHDYADPGSEQHVRFGDFNAWFRQAIEDFIEFGV